MLSFACSGEIPISGFNTLPNRLHSTSQELELSLPENAPTLRAGSMIARSGSSVGFLAFLVGADMSSSSRINYSSSNPSQVLSMAAKVGCATSCGFPMMRTGTAEVERK